MSIFNAKNSMFSLNFLFTNICFDKFKMIENLFTKYTLGFKNSVLIFSCDIVLQQLK